MAALTAIKSPLLETLLNTKKASLLQAFSMLAEGPIHVLLPQQVADNIQQMRCIFAEYGVNGRIYASHKPTKSKALIKQLEKEGILIDVSSKKEIISALSEGFSGDRICCTGVKNDAYLRLAIQHNCLISIDSIEEFDRLATIKSIVSPVQHIDILLRMNPSESECGCKDSRFGVNLSDLDDLYSALSNSDDINLLGFHIHSGDIEPDIRTLEFSFILNLLKGAYKKGFTPSVLNIGGAFPVPFYEFKNETENFVNALIDQTVQGGESLTWHGYPYSLMLGEGRVVIGQEMMRSRFKSRSPEDILHRILSSTAEDGRKNSEMLKDCEFSLAIEPGRWVYDQAGLLVMKVLNTKQTPSGESLVVLDGNILNISSHLADYMADPIVLSLCESIDKPYEAFLVGNLCTYTDILIKRKVALNRKPKTGDYLCFVNTGAYVADFQDATPHQHPTGQKLVAVQCENTWRFMHEDQYNPYEV